jgi:hypothetical protein
VFKIHHIGIVNNQVQVLNAGLPPLLVTCPAGFGNAVADDQAAFYITNHVLHKTTWDTSATTFTGDTVLVDFANCPGASAFPIINGSEMSMDQSDNIFANAVGPFGEQGMSWVMQFYKANTNQCRATDLQTGQIYDWCTPGASCASEAPTGTLLANGGNTCWGIPKWTGTATLAADGKTLTWASGQKFSFDAGKLLTLYQGNSCSATGGLHCIYPISTISSNTQLTLSSVQTAAFVGCGSLPCTVNFTAINGVHGVQMSWDGNYSEFSWGQNGRMAISGPDNPSATASLTTFCSTAAVQPSSNISLLPTATANNVTQWVNSLGTSTQGISGYQGAGWHPSLGVTHSVNTWSTGPNLRSFTDASHWTVFAPAFTTVVDMHGTWAHYCNGTSSATDNCYIEVSDTPATTVGTGACGNPTYCPKYLNLAVLAYFPSAGTITNPVVFFHQYNCGSAAGTKCNDGAAGANINSISYTDPQGRFTCWASDMLHNIGHDGSGAKEIAAFCGMLQ